MGNKLHEIKADYKYWVKWNDWDLSQMTALLLGYDPFLLNKNYIEQLEGGIIPTNLSQKEIESLVEEYDRANSLIMNSIEVGKLNFRTSPKKFYDWALVMNIPLVEEFHSEISLNGDIEKDENGHYKTIQTNYFSVFVNNKADSLTASNLKQGQSIKVVGKAKINIGSGSNGYPINVIDSISAYSIDTDPFGKLNDNSNGGLSE